MNKELEGLVDEIFPYTSEYSYNLKTIVTEEEAIEYGFSHNETLLERRDKLMKKKTLTKEEKDL